MKRVELLAPAKDLAIGMAAINNGADAVYIGAPAFGARKAAANSLEDIEVLVRYAHRFYCRVFVTLNTILYDEELKEAERLIRQLYEIGVDALIIQDMGILKLDLPPISLHASTQMHNYDLERIKFLDKLGFQRIVLARELSLEQIREIRREVKAELEVFIHGALCVSLSGQCYLSQHLFGRSANRGECAQPCRMKWSVKDSAGKVLVRDKYILSLKDLNMSSYIKDLIDIGVDSLKIEGRLKEENYVSNITNHYHSLVDQALQHEKEQKRSGSGIVQAGYIPDPERSFSRGFTDYFTQVRKPGMVNMDTPKSMGKFVGTVKQVKKESLLLEGTEPIHNGDGLCYLEGGELKGIKVNTVEGNTVCCNEILSVRAGTRLYRNYDHRFVMKLEKEKSVRKIRIRMVAEAVDGHLQLAVTDEDGVSVVSLSEQLFEPASNPSQQERICQQLAKCGDSDYQCEGVEYQGESVLFIPAAAVNGLRRELLQRLSEEREQCRQVVRMGRVDEEAAYKKEIDWHHNVVNRNASLFYSEHGAERVDSGFEKRAEPAGKDLMHTRYCILFEIGRCRKCQRNEDLKFPLYINNAKEKFRLEFDCAECFMKIVAEEK